MNDRNSDCVSVSTKFTYVTEDDLACPVRTKLEWDPKDPFAITIRFIEHRAVWIISRELAFDALTREQAGEGDVVFTQPRCTCCVFMELDGHGGYAKFLVPRDSLVEILTQAAFLPGDDLGAEVERWLAEVTL